MNMSKRKPMTPKGFWIRCYTAHSSKDISGFKSLPDIELAVTKYGPQIIKIEAHVGSKLLKTFIREEGNKTMGKFSTFANENPNTGYAPFADSIVKESLAAFEIPFSIVGSKTVESTKFTNQDGSPQTSIWYNIELDTKSDKYQWAQKVKNIETAYTLQLPDSPRRQKQLVELINPEIAQNGGCMVKLVKRGKAYDFDDAE